MWDSLNIPLQDTYTWTDSAIVISWLDVNLHWQQSLLHNGADTDQMLETCYWDPEPCRLHILWFPSELLEYSL